MSHLELSVFRERRHCGYLVQEGSQDWRFVYNNALDERQFIGSRFPIREKAYVSRDVRAFFRNLLPGPELSRRASELLGLTPGNDFALLSELCRDTTGGLQIVPAGEAPLHFGQLRHIQEAELVNIMSAMQIDPLLTRIEGYRVALPGEHAKLAVRLDQEGIALPLGDELSSHLIKPAYRERRESLENESFCTALAAALGMPVVKLKLIHASSNYLLIERFDRTFQNGVCSAIHVEDFCQLSLLEPEYAFQREGGPSATECVELLRNYSVQPGLDIKQFLRWLGFNFLIGNGRAHAKQLALIYAPEGPRLAPFYGLSSTHIYPSMNPQMALHLGKESRPDWMIPARWREFAQSAGIRPKYMLRVLEELAADLIADAPKVEARWQQANGYAEVTRNIRTLVERRARQIAVSLQAEAA